MWEHVTSKDYLLNQRPDFRYGPIWFEWRVMAGCYRLHVFSYMLYLTWDCVRSLFANKQNGIRWP